MNCKRGCTHIEKVNSGEQRIVILQRGWVMVGEFSQKGAQCSLDNAYVIRTWGTKKGLGELVNGPLKETVLDSCGHVEFNELTIVASIKVRGF